MRDILFKAKSIETNEWVYGYIQYNYDNTRARIISSLNIPNLDFPVQYVEVYPNTVCQLIDVIGIKKTIIFEGDKVRQHVIEGNDLDSIIIAKMGYKFKEKERFYDGNASGYTYYSYEVIGNIHDK